MPRIVQNSLTVAKIKRLKEAGTYADGQGLYLAVTKTGARSWMFRYANAGRVREMGLGSARDVSLAEAREAAAELRQQRWAGVDPADERKARKAADKAARAAPVRSFRACAQRYIQANKAGWKNAKHAAQWAATLESYAFPTIGEMSVAKIETDHVLSILEPIWATKTETASRVRGRIESVIDYAKALGWRASPNPAAWKGHLKALLPARNKVVAVRHHSAMPYADVPAFVRRLRDMPGMSARALEYTILTAARTGEAIGATVREIDPETATWIVPAERMKAGREHRVPLCARALEIIREVDGFPYLFPGARQGRPLSNMAMDKVLRTAGLDVTVHGFRSAFRDWAAEQTDFPREIAEACLAHTLKDKTEAAYRRTDFLEKRRDLLRLWAAFVCDERIKHGVPPGFKPWPTLKHG